MVTKDARIQVNTVTQGKREEEIRTKAEVGVSLED